MTPEDPAAINARLLQHLQRIVDEYRIQGFGHGLANAIRLASREIDGLEEKTSRPAPSERTT